jgi:hypothetical protein
MWARRKVDRKLWDRGKVIQTWSHSDKEKGRQVFVRPDERQLGQEER